MQCALLIYNHVDTGSSTRSPDAMRRAAAAYKAFTEAMKEAGAYTGSHGFALPSAATTVRVRNGKSQLLSGPHADAKEQLGGIYLIDVPDLDAARSWAASCPSAEWGAVEVRPLWGQ